MEDVLNTAVLKQASETARERRFELDQLLSTDIPSYSSDDTSLVVFGSLARGEWTSGSDLDWTYLIDGQANSDHLVIAQKINDVLQKHGERFRPPGQTGTFGNMAFSHDIIRSRRGTGNSR